MIKIEIPEIGTVLTKTRAGLVPSVEMTFTAGRRPHDVVVVICLDADAAELLSNHLMAQAVAINGRPPLDKSTALDGAAAV